MTPHQKIMRAAKRGAGLRLSAQEVYYLSRDSAIETCATLDDDRGDRTPCSKGGYCSWRIDGAHSNEFCEKCYRSKP